MTIVLRSGAEIGAPVEIVAGYLERWRFDAGDTTSGFGEADLRLANRGGARISATEIGAVLERRPRIERALRAVPPDTSLAAKSVPWPALGELVEAFAGIGGFGLSKLTKTLHPKRPALVPMLDSVVQRHLQEEDPGASAPFAERAIALVRAYERDLDRNRQELRAVRRELARRGHDMTEVRILDLLIWSVEVGP